jgi:hypothetical protein
VDIKQLPPTIADLLALIAGGDEIVIEYEIASRYSYLIITKTLSTAC